jgi:hypothetical protein
VAASPVVEDLHPVEDGRREFHPGHPLPRVEELGLHASPERLDRGVVERVADGAQRVGQAGSADALTECPRRVLAELNELGCEPWSLCTRAPLEGLRASMAMPSAALTIAAVARRSSDQPTTRRDQASSTTQQ